MNAWTLAALAAACVQIGAIGAVSAIAAPAAFAALDRSAARAYVRGLFPRYFVLGGVLGLALAAAAALGGAPLPALAGLANAALFGYALSLVPRIQAARDGGASTNDTAHLHRRSVAANGAALLLAVLAAAWLLAGGPP